MLHKKSQVAPARHKQRKILSSNKDPVQPKILFEGCAGKCHGISWVCPVFFHYLPLGAPALYVVFYSILSLLHTYYMQEESNKCFLTTFLCLYQNTGQGSYHVFALYCWNLLALVLTCVVSAPRLPHLYWHSGILSTTLPGHKLSTKGHRGKDWAAGKQHRRRGQLKEDIVCHLEINRNLFHLKANWRRSLREPRERAQSLACDFLPPGSVPDQLPQNSTLHKYQFRMLSRCMCVDHLSSSDPLTSEVFLQWNVLPLMHLLPNLPQNSPLRNFSFLKQLPSPALVNSYISMYHHQHQCLLPILLHVSENFPNMNGGERSFMSCSLLFSQHLHSRLLVWFWIWSTHLPNSTISLKGPERVRLTFL